MPFFFRSRCFKATPVLVKGEIELQDLFFVIFVVFGFLSYQQRDVVML